MFKLRTLRFALLGATLAVLVNLFLTVETYAKQGRGRFNDRKSGKFINGHDARDGRWDGRGPRSRFGDRRGRDRRFIFRDRRDRDDRFRFRDRWDRDDRRDRWRDDDWRRRRMRGR